MQQPIMPNTLLLLCISHACILKLKPATFCQSKHITVTTIAWNFTRNTSQISLKKLVHIEHPGYIFYNFNIHRFYSGKEVYTNNKFIQRRLLKRISVRNSHCRNGLHVGSMFDSMKIYLACHKYKTSKLIFPRIHYLRKFVRTNLNVNLLLYNVILSPQNCSQVWKNWRTSKIKTRISRYVWYIIPAISFQFMYEHAVRVLNLSIF